MELDYQKKKRKLIKNLILIGSAVLAAIGVICKKDKKKEFAS